MKIGIYDPYLDTLGGGERYMLTLASVLAEKTDNTVDLFWDGGRDLIDRGGERFGLDVSKLTLFPNIFSSSYSLFQKIRITKTYDAIFFLSDGSVPTLSAKKNFLLFQHPIPWVRLGFFSRIKLRKISRIIVNSTFVKTSVDHSLRSDSFILYPPVTSVGLDLRKKENVILTVGRFTRDMNTKKQAEMIEAFKKMCDNGLTNWEFVVVGSSLPEDQDLVDDVKKGLTGYPIRVLHNVSYQTLLGYYEKAKIYWHAAGFGEDLHAHPERAEHFGISTVEAMSAGTVPVVFSGGGQKEIIDDKKNGFLWKTENELIGLTTQLIDDKELLFGIAKNAQERSVYFDEAHFRERVEELLK